MKGDFSRGYRPDHQRGKRYRRALLQQGRLVLDSDVAAGADAVDRTIRDLAGDIGGRAGGPDGGYVVTTGPLFARFDEIDRVALGAGSMPDFRFYRDHAKRLFERSPALALDAAQGSGAVVIAGRRTFTSVEAPQLRMLAELPPSGFTVRFGASDPVAVVAGPPVPGTPFTVWDVSLPPGLTTFDDVTLELEAGQAWIALIEGYQVATAELRFWATRGRYYVDGFAVEQPADALFPRDAFPWPEGPEVPPQPAAPVPAVATPSTMLVAYLEAREQLVTAVEDPGMREAALGGGPDTAVRTRAVSTVKLADFEGASGDLEGAAERAFQRVQQSYARLRVATTAATYDPDPCALPAAGGYAGADHRLYRFEAHDGGTLGTGVGGGASVKWSRNNGAELAEVVEVLESPGRVRLARDIGLRDDDVLEFLTDREELWDEGAARVDLVGESFRPPRRATGVLFTVRRTERPLEYALFQPLTNTAASVPAERAGRPGRKARRWDGLLRSTEEAPPAVVHFELPDGISIELSGEFQPGDWWDYEARAGAANANPPWDAPRPPQGPERLFAPLALLEYVGDEEPLRLRRWYDRRPRALDALDAGGVSYDARKARAPHRTVQEALDDLLLHRSGGCCEAELAPVESGNDALRVSAAITDALPDGGVLCLRAGVYRIESTVPIEGRAVEIRGFPGAVLLCTSAGPSFTVAANAELTLRGVVIRRTDSAEPAVQLDAMTGGMDQPAALRLRGVALLHLAEVADTVAIRFASLTAPTPDPAVTDMSVIPLPGPNDQARVDIEDSVIFAHTAALLAGAPGLRLARSRLVFDRLGLCAARVTDASIDECALAIGYTPARRDDLLAVPLSRLPEGALPLLRDISGGSSAGVCVLANTVQRLTLRRSSLGAEHGLWAETLDTLAFEGNRHLVRNAVRAQSATAVTLDRETITADRYGLYVSATATAVAVRACTVMARTGVLLGCKPDLTANTTDLLAVQATVTDLQVLDNTFSTPAPDASRPHALVQIGPSPAGESMRPVLPQVGAPMGGTLISTLSYPAGDLPPMRFGEIERVLVQRNRFIPGPFDYGPDVCVACTLVDVIDGDATDCVSVGTIEGNEIRTGMVGVLVRGPGWMVRNNTINRRTTALPTSETRFALYAGIVLWDCGRAADLGNKFSMMSSAVGNAIDILVRTGSTEQPHAAAIVVRATAELLPSYVNVQNNVISCHMALVSLDLSNLLVSGNCVGNSFMFVGKCVAGTVRDNRFGPIGGGVEFLSCTAMAVVDNDFVYLAFDNLVGSVQVVSNRIVGDVRILPAYVGGAPFGTVPPGSLPGSYSSYTPPGVASPAEYPVRIQVCQNWCGNLFVGNPSTGPTPVRYHPATSAQVVGNVANDSVNVAQYFHLIIDGNMAANFHLPPAVTDLVLIGENLDMDHPLP